MPITILDLARHRGVKLEGNSVSGGAMDDVGLELMGGCDKCETGITCTNAYPSKSGYWKCKKCIGYDGWEDVEQAEIDIKVMIEKENRIIIDNGK